MKKKKEIKPDTTETLPLGEYDFVLVMFSGGKDSLALALHALELGVPKEKIILCHHNIDGAPGSKQFMDWKVTESYVRSIAKALGLRLLFSWREGGFKWELLKENARSKAVGFERLDGTIGYSGGKKGKIASRGMFPQVSADLQVRWCSPHLKISVSTGFINNEPSFLGKKLLVLTGERRGESSNRAAYAEKIAHSSSNKKRRVDQWRAVLDWTETQVWEIIERWNVRPHPAYVLGWGRVSCMACIFGDKNQWASVKEIAPSIFEEIAALEDGFKVKLKQGTTIRETAKAGMEFVTGKDQKAREWAVGDREFTAEDAIVGDGWKIPAGAFKKCGGPS